MPQHEPMLKDSSEKPKPSRDPCKTIAKFFIIFISFLLILASIGYVVYKISNPGYLYTSFTTQHKEITLKPISEDDCYTTFKYNVINNTYSHKHQDGSLIEPYGVKNVERVEDRTLNIVYLHKKETNATGFIYWKFQLNSTGTPVKKIEIRMKGIEEITNNGGKAEACLQSLTVCMAIPIKKWLKIQNPNIDTLYIYIFLNKDINIFKTELKDGSSVKSFTIDVFWQPQPDERLFFPISSNLKQIELEPNLEENYLKFTYNIIDNTYSHKNRDGSLAEPYITATVERVVDIKLNEAYLQKIRGEDYGLIYWDFNLQFFGKLIEKIEIKMPGIDEIPGEDAKACLYKIPPVFYEKDSYCGRISTNGTINFEKPNFERLSLRINLYEDIRIFKTELKNGSNVESFSVEFYWKPTS